MRLHEKILSDYLRHTYGVTNPLILETVGKVLSGKEQGGLELHASVVTGKKLVVICNRPERLQEVILIGRQNPQRIERRSLALKSKNDPSEA